MLLQKERGINKMKTLTKSEFCEMTGTPVNCWIFNGAENPSFYVGSDDRVYFNNKVDTLWQFLLDDGRVLASHKGLGPGDMWAGWADWTD